MAVGVRISLAFALTAFVCGCHYPRGDAFPGYSPEEVSVPAAWGETVTAELSEQKDRYVAFFRYRVTKFGDVVAVAKAENPDADLRVEIYFLGSNTPLAKCDHRPAECRATGLGPGTYYVGLIEQWHK